MAIKNETIKDIYDLFRLNNLRVAYCPNDSLGLDGPFKEVDENEIIEIINNNDFVDYRLKNNSSFLEDADIMISGE